MANNILNGKEIQTVLGKKLSEKISLYNQKPKLIILSLGEDERSSAYIRSKINFGEQIGVEVENILLPLSTTQEMLIDQINKYNLDRTANGIIVQMPLPENISKEIFSEISPEKDVDGLHPLNLGKLVKGERAFLPATARGVIELLSSSGVSIAGKRVAIIGRSSLVGKPLALAFLNLDATVTILHSRTPDISDITKQADIVCIAVGSPKFFTKEFINKEQIIIDIGINVVQGEERKKLIGDVDFENVAPLVSSITPVPGGVGPMTVYALFANLCDAYESQRESSM